MMLQYRTVHTKNEGTLTVTRTFICLSSGAGKSQVPLLLKSTTCRQTRCLHAEASTFNQEVVFTVRKPILHGVRFGVDQYDAVVKPCNWWTSPPGVSSRIVSHDQGNKCLGNSNAVPVVSPL